MFYILIRKISRQKNIDITGIFFSISIFDIFSISQQPNQSTETHIAASSIAMQETGGGGGMCPPLISKICFEIFLNPVRNMEVKSKAFIGLCYNLN